MRLVDLRSACSEWPSSRAISRAHWTASFRDRSGDTFGTRITSAMGGSLALDLLDRVTAVHDKRSPCDVARPIAREERDRLRDLVRGPGSAEWRREPVVELAVIERRRRGRSARGGR